MTSKKSTKRALLLSGLALLMCFSMLISSTYAWFTDSVTSGKNKIVSGNLDVELEYYNGDTKAWEKVSENTNVFEENTLWEPGHTEVVYLKVSNLGSLALKYALNINVAKEIESVNVDGEILRLSKYIEYDVIQKDAETLYADRKTAREEAAKDTGYDATPLNEQYYNKTGVLYPANNIPTDPADAASEQYITLVVYMPEETGNEANYRVGEAVPEILLGINLVATQLPYEEDSFGSDYDKNSQHSYLPEATIIETTVKDTEMLVFSDLNDFSKNTKKTITLDAAYEFRTLDSEDTALYNDYSDWFVDYYVSINRDIAPGVMLAGAYGSIDWIGIEVPAGNYGEEVGLLGMFSNGVSNWEYADIVSGVNIFNCGVVNVNNENAGATMTVKLCLINPEDSNDRIVISETKHTFAKKITNSEELKAAIDAGETDLYLEAGDEDYVLPNASVQNKTLNIIGKEGVVIDITNAYTPMQGLYGATITFENVTIKSDPQTEGYNRGYAHANKFTYNNCVIEGTLGLNNDNEFNNCTFNISGNYYNLWTWGAANVTLNGCTFNSDGKAVLLYGQANTKLTVNNCEFNDNGGLTSKKAAIEIGNDYDKSYELIVNNTTVNGYEINDEGINTGSTLWANKNSMPQDKLNVVVNGVDVY